MNYTLHQLTVFLEIYKQKSITKAAEELHLTQPAVSIQLKKLQDQFEIPLTEVIGRQLYITDFGEKIAEVSTRILKEAETIKTTLNQYKGLLVGKLSISSASTGKYVIPYFLNEFVKQHPGVEISIDVTNKSRVIEKLASNDTDFALVSVLPEDIPIHTVELIPNKLFLVGSKEFVKQNDAPVSPKEIEEMLLIFREKGSATRLAMENFLQSNEIKVGRRMELVSNEAVKQAVNAGLGYSIMPLIGLKNELLSGSIRIIPAKGLPIVTAWNLTYLKNKNMSPVALALIDFLKHSKEQTMLKYFDWQKEFN